MDFSHRQEGAHMAGTSQIGCTLDSLSAKLLSLPILCAVLRHPPLPRENAGGNHMS